jgi:predicted unusual protein kinase regulating ubiquinone biosynthesis (AarF/ABC1/UbiB family)
MPTQTVRDTLAADLGEDWRDRMVWLDGAPSAAASIGQVHRARWQDSPDEEPREVAVKVQYPDAGEALRSDLRQLARVARTMGPLVPGLDLKPLVEELQARALEELDYDLEAQAQRAFAEAFRDDPDIVVPDVVAVGPRTLVTEWLDSPASLAQVIAGGTPTERDHYGGLLTRFLFAGPDRTGMLHADPHPGNFRILPREPGDLDAPGTGPGRMGVLDYGAVARLPGGRLPEAMGRLIRMAVEGDSEGVEAGLRAEGFVKERIRVDAAELFDYLRPFVVPAQHDTFRFSREWMRGEFERINDPHSPGYTVALKLNLPPSYLLIHRTWLAGVGVLSQLEAEVPVRAVLTEHLPGFASPV